MTTLQSVDGQARALLFAVKASEAALPQLTALCWIEYARERFKAGSDKQESAMLSVRTLVAASYLRLKGDAGRAGRVVQFTEPRLRLFAIKALEHVCPLCSECFGVDSFAVVWEDMPRAEHGHRCGLLNTVVCCSVCAQGKGELSADEWLDVMQALRSSDTARAGQAREAIAGDGGCPEGSDGKRYFPLGAGRR
jgi:hypothetical protein